MASLSHVQDVFSLKFSSIICTAHIRAKEQDLLGRLNDESVISSLDKGRLQSALFYAKLPNIFLIRQHLANKLRQKRSPPTKCKSMCFRKDLHVNPKF